MNVISQFNPQNIDSLKLWINASNVNIGSDGKIDTLYDMSGNNNHAHQINSSKRPVIGLPQYSLNGHFGIDFDGDNDFFDLPLGSFPNQNYTLFAVVKPYTSDGPRTIISRAYVSADFLMRFNNQDFESYVNTNSQSIENVYSTEQNTFLVFSNYNNTTRNLQVNQSMASEISQSGLINYNTINRPALGSLKRSNGATAHHFNGQIIEIILYAKSLSQNETINVSDYFYQKYAPPVNFSSDINISYGFCDTTLSSPNYYTSYLWSNGSTDSTTIINEPGEYWLEGVDIFGRITRDTIEVIRPPYDDIQLQNQIVCFNQLVTITANTPTGNYSFVQWSDGTTNPTRILNQNESISFTVIDSLGCTGSSNTAVVSIDNSLEFISLGMDTSLCSGNSIQLIQDTSVISNWLWNTQDTTSNITVDTSGVYILNITNDNGCQNSDTIEVTVIGTAPSLSYSIENDICQGSQLLFNESSTVPPGNTITDVIWNFGELDSVFTSAGTQVYLDSGIYIGFLEVSTLEGCSSKENFVVEVFPKPIISFETTNYCPYEEIGFTPSNNYNVPLSSFNWNFDQDGNTSTEGFPSYSYGLTGNYDVELVAIDSNSCIDTVVQSVYVQPAPIADISIVNPCEVNALEISDNSSITDTFSIVTYAWNYGDNTSAINPTEEKSFEEYGAYTVQLVLTADNGCVDSTEQNITVHPNPILNYEVGPACMNTWTNLSDLSEIPLGSLSESNWLINLQFSDNQTNTAFKFPTKGIQLIALQSTSDQGCVRDTSFTIDVAAELSAEFTVSPNTLITETPMLFTNQSLNIDSSYWDFGNGNGLEYNINNLNEVTYDSNLNGSSIDVMLIVNNQLGCRDTSVQTFTIKEAFYDLAIETIFVQDINGYLTVGAEIQNLGSIPLENADLFLKTPENGSIQESWTGSIAQDASEIYIFNAHPTSYISSQDETDRYVCVEGIGVNSLGSPDVNPNNNTTCKNIESTGLIVLPIYPNPTEDDITISIVLTESSVLNIELVDQSGRLIYSQNNPEGLEPGIHNIQLPFSQLNKGIYYVRVSDDATTLLEKIVRL